MKRGLAIGFSVVLLVLGELALCAQSARQLTRRVVPQPNTPAPAGGAAANRPAPPPPSAVPASTNLAVPRPPPPADPEKAKQETLKKTIEFQKKRAAEGSPSAQYDLGLRYLTGDGVEQDEAAGVKLLEQSAAQDYSPAKKELEALKERDKKKRK